MKFTLKLQLDSPSELAAFIQDMNMEIDMPFIETSMANEQVLQNLTKTIVNYELKIHSLEKQLENSVKSNIQAFENYLDENLPVEPMRTECPAIQPIQNHFTENTDSDNNERLGMSIVAKLESDTINHTNIPEKVEDENQTPGNTNEKPARNYVMKPKPCQECGKDFIAHHNKVKWCNDCRSKKVKYPTHKPD